MLPRLLAAAALAAALAPALPGPSRAQSAAPLEASAYTKATPRRVVRMTFDGPAEAAQEHLLRHVDRFDPTIVEVRFDNAGSATPGEIGVGSVRICVFEDGRELHEPILAYESGVSHAYTVDAEASTLGLPVSEITLLYDFVEAGGATDVTVRAFYDPRIPGTGPVIEPVLTGTLRRTFQAAVDRFGGTYLGDEKP